MRTIHLTTTILVTLILPAVILHSKAGAQSQHRYRRNEVQASKKDAKHQDGGHGCQFFNKNDFPVRIAIYQITLNGQSRLVRRDYLEPVSKVVNSGSLYFSRDLISSFNYVAYGPAERTLQFDHTQRLVIQKGVLSFSGVDIKFKSTHQFTHSIVNKTNSTIWIKWRFQPIKYGDDIEELYTLTSTTIPKSTAGSVGSIVKMIDYGPVFEDISQQKAISGMGGDNASQVGRHAGFTLAARQNESDGRTSITPSTCTLAFKSVYIGESVVFTVIINPGGSHTVEYTGKFSDDGTTYITDGGITSTDK